VYQFLLYLAIFVLLFCTSICYALALQSRWARVWLEEKAWISVVIGVGYTIAFLLPLIGGWATLMVLAAFVVSGLPIVVRSLINEMKRYRQMVERENGRGSA